MTVPAKNSTQEASLGRELLYAARFYLGRPRALLVLAAVAVSAGLALNWNWLVAAGLAPILLSALPCLIMCGFGVCMMCRSGDKDPAPTHRAGDTADAATTTAITNTPSAAANCCHGAADETRPETTADPKSNRERKQSNA